MTKRAFINKRKFFIYGILIIAIILRINYALTSRLPITSDALQYFTLANNILSGNGFSINNIPTAYAFPGYPFFLSILFYSYHSLFTVTVVQSICDCVTCYLMFRIAEKINLRTAIASSAVWAVYPPAVLFSAMLLTETLFIMFCVIMGFYAIAKNSWNFFDLIFLGVLTGWGILIKPQFIIIAAVFIFYKWKLRGNHGIILKHIIVLSSIAGIIVSFWFVRNVVLMNSATLSTNGGVNFWIGNNPSARGGYYFAPGNEIDTIASETEKNTIGYKRGFEFIVNHPVKFIVVASFKIAHLFGSQNYFFRYIDSDIEKKYSEIVREHSLHEKIHLNLLFIIVIIAGTIGLFLLHQSMPILGKTLLSIIVLWVGFYLLHFGNARFLFPLMPLFSIGAGTVISYKSLTITSRARFYVLVCIIAGFISVITAETLIYSR